MKSKKSFLILAIYFYTLAGHLDLIGTPEYLGKSSKQSEFSLSSSISLDLPFNVQEEAQFKNIETATKAVACDSANAITFLDLLTSRFSFATPPIDIFDFLAEDIYHKTYPPTMRSIHDLPLLSTHIPASTSSCWSFGLTPFFNATNKMYFAKNSNQLGSYISLSNNLIEQIDNIVSSTTTSAAIDTATDIIHESALRELRLGALLTTWKAHKNWLFSFALPVYYLEHNISIPDDDQDAIRRQLLFVGGNFTLSPFNVSFPGVEFDSFRYQHFMCDKFGLGDLRFQTWYNFAHEQELPFRLGGQITFPTAFAFQKGIIGGPGSCPCKHQERPFVDLYELMDLFLNFQHQNIDLARGSEMLLGYGVSFLDHLGAIILNRSLGEQHINLGPVLHAEYALNNYFLVGLDSELKVPLPANETRSFKIIKNPIDRTIDARDFTNEHDACNNINFLSEQMTDLLYPPTIKIATWPGIIFKATATYSFIINKHLKTSFGYDFWAQTKEHLLNTRYIHSCYGPLNFNAGTRPAAYEGKLVGSLSGLLITDHHNVDLALQGDGTIHNRGIGQSYTISFHLGIDL